ncbi:class I SAM-dependent methyltransferase [Schinkia azotoformans]|uniref:class I SAM-dependent methyltransferase n=1 Tax=Schinkia azotoformans TaxID=1454 RepID=UPI002DB9A592|nr:class I SAM-dependent methyltransferase [Schinkia azotoformans]MEC1722053.1 class I SAM-dependent methyltransferase [Schinkia azotoformans]MED4415242.1 class I SAM-dependent methyltransferase [Schinkia azotoformans]
MVLISSSTYLDFLSKMGVGGAHPGGLNLTKEIFNGEKINSNSHILDVGCGTGQTAAYLAAHYGAKVTAMDINPIMIEKAKSRMKQYQLPVEVIQGSIEDFPLKDNTFDFILSESVLSFVNKPRALKEIFRLLKNGGRFIANELTINKPLNPSNEKEIKQFYGLDSLLGETDWIALFEQTGFKNIKVLMQKNSMFQNDSMPEFQYSKYIEPNLYTIMIQHLNILMKYQGILDNRIFLCTK